MKFLAVFLLGFVLGFALVVGVLGWGKTLGVHPIAKPDPRVWCDAPPVDGAGAPTACK